MLSKKQIKKLESIPKTVFILIVSYSKKKIKIKIMCQLMSIDQIKKKEKYIVVLPIVSFIQYQLVARDMNYRSMRCINFNNSTIIIIIVLLLKLIIVPVTGACTKLTSVCVTCSVLETIPSS